MKVAQIVKKMATKSATNEMLIFGLCSTFDHQPSILSDESCPKCEKMAAKSSKNEILIFGLHSIFDHQPSILSDKEVAQNARKWPPNHQN